MAQDKIHNQTQSDDAAQQKVKAARRLLDLSAAQFDALAAGRESVRPGDLSDD